jgi:hypothetical protein
MENCSCKDQHDNDKCDICGKSDECELHKDEVGYIEKCRGCKAYFCAECGDVWGSKECYDCIEKSEESES